MDPLTVGMVAAPVVGGVASYLSGKGSQKFQAREASKQRAWAAGLANTQWQRAVRDMEAAGINPALAYSQGGAATPGGASASSGVVPGSEGVHSAIAVKQLQEQVKQIRDQRAQVQAQTRKIGTERNILTKQLDMETARWQYYFNADGTIKKPMRELLEREHGAKIANAARSVTDLELARFSIPERKAVAGLYEALGSQGKGMQIALPLILQLIRNQGMVTAAGMRK